VIQLILGGTFNSALEKFLADFDAGLRNVGHLAFKTFGSYYCRSNTNELIDCEHLLMLSLVLVL
jgi:hypothetical protein